MLSALPWLKLKRNEGLFTTIYKGLNQAYSLRLAGSKEFSVRLSKRPNDIVGFVHEPMLGKAACAACSGVGILPSGRAGVVAKSVTIPKAALKASACAPPDAAEEAACCPCAHAASVEAGALQLVLS